MSAIKVLSKEISELIAAGEVIERPASVIKELVENSIDSGATHITVEIRNGGVTYMRVTDNGCGIAFDEVPTAFLRHATSKINSKDDLEKIYTLGFRGEALASVAAVSRVELLTKRRDDEYATSYLIDGGTEVMHEKTFSVYGTTIIVRDLFYNVPARAKFLKKDITEANAVSQMVQKMILSHPEISFKFIRDGHETYFSAGDGHLYSAIYAVFGKDFANDLIPVDYEYNKVRVSGYTVKPLYSRKNRTFQNFFVNGRYVRSKICSAALENAYDNLTMTGRFPACVLMTELSAANMDVNIHPSKAEVRFTNEKDITDAIFFAIKNALSANGLIYEFDITPAKSYGDYKKPDNSAEDFVKNQMTFTPDDKAPWEEDKKPDDTVSLEEDEKTAGSSDDFLKSQTIFTPVDKIPEKEKEIAEHDRIYGTRVKPKIKEVYDRNDTTFLKISSDHPRDNTVINRPIEIDEDNTQQIQNETDNEYKYLTKEIIEKIPPECIEPYEDEPPFDVEFPDIKVVGELFGLYVICESRDKMIIIDKHAAHERIIFENLKNRNCRQYCQQLITPVKVLLTSEECDVLQNNTQLLEDMGFKFDFSESPLAAATAVPTFAMELELESIIQEIAENLVLCKHDPKSHALDDILHTVACKAAIKANDKNTVPEMKALAQQVCNNDSIRHCPHGRPVMFTMTKYKIDHQFKRK